jgi:hypothetical protein
MLPATIVGTVITSRGREPFALDSATGAVRTGTFAAPDRDLGLLGAGEKSAVERQVRSAVAGVRQVRVAELCCPRCDRWVDVARHPGDWAGDRCSRC